MLLQNVWKPVLPISNVSQYWLDRFIYFSSLSVFLFLSFFYSSLLPPSFLPSVIGLNGLHKDKIKIVLDIFRFNDKRRLNSSDFFCCTISFLLHILFSFAVCACLHGNVCGGDT